MKRTLLPVVLMLMLAVSCAPIVHGPEVRPNGVRFTVVAPGAQSVAIAGSFNRWDLAANPLTGPDARGVWETTLVLPAGTYTYQYVLNRTEWMPDPGAPSVDDGMGGRNSVVVVEPGPE